MVAVIRAATKRWLFSRPSSLGYLISGFIIYILRQHGGQPGEGDAVVQFPRGAFMISWALTIVFIEMSRLCSALWRWIIEREMQRRTVEERRSIENILVVGGAGYIGSALLKPLLDKGYKVRLLDLFLYGSDPISEVMHHPELEIIKADFRQIDRVVEAMQGIDIVVHLGAIVGDPSCDLDDKLTIEVNVTATRMVAEVAKNHHVDRFIFASTCSVYGFGEELLDERSKLQPVSLYARSKLAAEQMLLQAVSPGFSPVILRFGTIYGFSGRIRFDLVVNLLTAKAIKEGKIMIYGGDQWRPFVHVEDAAQGILKVIEAPLDIVRKQIFNIGSNEQNYRVGEIGELVKSVIPSTEIRNVENGEDNFDPRNYRVNFDKIRNIIGFSPEWTVKEGIKQVAKAIRSGQIKDYGNSLYNNERFLMDEGASILQTQSQEWMESYLNEVIKEEET